MKKIVMLGYSNKVDFVVGIAKTMQMMQNKVLVVDATENDKYKYVIPTIENNNSSGYISTLDNVDYAVGFEGYNNLEQYLFEQNETFENYDYIIFDIETSLKYEFFKVDNIHKYYFVFDTSMITFAKNVELFETIKIYSGDVSKIDMKKILYRGYITRLAEDYFEKKFNELGFNLSEDVMQIYEDERDRMQELDLYITGKVNFKKYSKDYINSIASVVENLLEDYHINTIKKAMKKGGM